MSTEVQQKKVTGCTGLKKQSCYSFSPRSNTVTAFFIFKFLVINYFLYRGKVQKKTLFRYFFDFLSVDASNMFFLEIVNILLLFYNILSLSHHYIIKVVRLGVF
ncbi:hypothetical protein AYK25_04330 [Thermoplasmatales archaeon SM1-50]|nr:MAG: hypothetical protein AYK25_04330 [Thermoplasmatales archaeon SM1-50]